jgi:hypothetical protein
MRPEDDTSIKWFITCFICVVSLSLSAQDCQGSYDREDLYGNDLVIREPFRCGTGRIENRRFEEQKEREEKGYYNIEGLEFYGSNGYYTKDSNLYFSSHKDSFVLVKNGDIASLQFEGNYIKDDNYIYSNGTFLPNVDPNSFVIFKESPYAVGEEYVYFSGSKANSSSAEGVLKIEGADPKSFKLLCDNKSNRNCSSYGRDRNHIYYLGKAIEGADPASYKLLENSFATDKNFVYYGGQKLEGSSGSTFEVLDYIYSKDKNNVYCYGNIIPGMNGSKFNLIGQSGMGTDGELINYRQTIFENGDPVTFVDLGCGYYKDANNVYSKGRLLELLDPATFEILDWGFTKDKKAVYCDDEPVLGANPKSFEVLGRKYSCDKKNVFYLRTLLIDCDRSSFIVDPNDPSKAEDSKANYNRGKRVKKK